LRPSAKREHCPDASNDNTPEDVQLEKRMIDCVPGEPLLSPKRKDLEQHKQQKDIHPNN
jgi:hypothetical protein